MSHGNSSCKIVGLSLWAAFVLLGGALCHHHCAYAPALRLLVGRCVYDLGWVRGGWRRVLWCQPVAHLSLWGGGGDVVAQ